MRRALAAAVVVALTAVGLTGCAPSFEEKCKADGNVYKSKSQSSMEYAFSASDGKYHWVLVTTTTRLCLDSETGDIIDMEVS